MGAAAGGSLEVGRKSMIPFLTGNKAPHAVQ